MTIAPFKVEAKSLDEGVGVVAISGELDQATAGRLSESLEESIGGGVHAVVIDMSECRFIDSTGLGVIVEAWKQLQEQNGDQASFAICCPEPEVRRLLEITGLDKEIAIRDTREEAIAVIESV